MKLTSSLSLGKYLRVGKLWIFTLSTSLAVESILAITISSRSWNFSASSSQIGANFLQWPHHGASVKQKKKRFNTVLKATILVSNDKKNKPKCLSSKPPFSAAIEPKTAMHETSFPSSLSCCFAVYKARLF